MKVTKATEYALRAIAQLAEDSERVRSAPALARDTGIPGRFLAKICSRLVSAGLLTSYPGARGGFVLSKPAGRITVWDVVSAVEDDPRLMDCLGADGECEEIDTCGLRPVFERAQEAMQAELMRTTLDEVVRRGHALKTWPRPESEAAASERPRPAEADRSPPGSPRATNGR